MKEGDRTVRTTRHSPQLHGSCHLVDLSHTSIDNFVRSDEERVNLVVPANTSDNSSYAECITGGRAGDCFVSSVLQVNTTTMSAEANMQGQPYKRLPTARKYWRNSTRHRTT
eukprot:768547-Hanusia_phi.AAC.2